MNRRMIIIWSIGMGIFGIMFGSLFGSIGDLASNPIFAQVLDVSGSDLEISLIKNLVALLVVLMGIVTVILGTQIIFQMKKDQLSGSMELFYPTGVSRTKVFLSHVVIGYGTKLLLLFIAVFSIWMGAKLFEVPNLEAIEYFNSFINFIPYVTIVFSISLALYVFFQKLTTVIFAFIGLSFFSLIIGELFQLPEWLNKFMIYGFLNDVPAQEINWTSWLILIGIAVILFIGSFIGYLRKDLRVMP